MASTSSQKSTIHFLYSKCILLLAHIQISPQKALAKPHKLYMAHHLLFIACDLMAAHTCIITSPYKFFPCSSLLRLFSWHTTKAASFPCICSPQPHLHKSPCGSPLSKVIPSTHHPLPFAMGHPSSLIDYGTLWLSTLLFALKYKTLNRPPSALAPQSAHDQIKRAVSPRSSDTHFGCPDLDEFFSMLWLTWLPLHIPQLFHAPFQALGFLFIHLTPQR
ncbi:hypothetical protein L7F22_051869 [Adiantum nelumboides]|nr:hypothetical protein [Adiantum nelumboides]